MTNSRKRGGDKPAVLCELCGRKQWIAMVKNIKLCKDCHDEYVKKKERKKSK